MPFERAVMSASPPTEQNVIWPLATCWMPAVEPLRPSTSTSMPSSFQKPASVGIEECAAWPTDMLVVVGPNFSFGISAACAAPAPMVAANAIAANRFIEYSRILTSLLGWA